VPASVVTNFESILGKVGGAREAERWRTVWKPRLEMVPDELHPGVCSRVPCAQMRHRLIFGTAVARQAMLCTSNGKFARHAELAGVPLVAFVHPPSWLVGL
jgi:hypothetical protein